MLVVEYPTTVPSSSNFEEEVVECRSKFVCIAIISAERRGRTGNEAPYLYDVRKTWG